MAPNSVKDSWPPYEEHGDDPERLTRRDVLVRGGFAAGALAAGSLLGSGKASAAQAFGGLVETVAPGVEHARAAIAQLRGPTAWVPPGPPFDAKKARGKRIFYLPGAFAPIINTIYTGMKEATAAVGMASPPTFNPQGLPSEFSRGIDQAIGRKTDCLIIEGIDPTLIQAPIKRAHALGMKIISVDSHDPSFPRPFPQVDQLIALPYLQAGRSIADWIISDSNGKANVYLLGLAGYHASDDVATGALGEFKKYAPATRVKVVKVTFPDVASLGTRIRVALTQDPSLNYIAVTFDFMALSVVPGVVQAGAANRVKLATFNASPPVMKWVNQKNVVAAEVGNSNKWHGWAQIDAALRLLTGNPRSTGEHIGLRIFDSTNIKSINIKAPEETWFGKTFPKDFRAGFKKLWMV